MLPLSFPPTFAQKKKKIIMAQVKKQLTELIGHTPLLELERLEKAHNTQARIIAKLEYFNPGGSVKDRIALAMIEDAEKRGLLKEGATIIEPTSGNTGVGLAWVASVKGYKTILTMPETMSIERQNLLKALGAQLVLTPGSKLKKPTSCETILLEQSSCNNLRIPQTLAHMYIPPHRKYGKTWTAK